MRLTATITKDRNPGSLTVSAVVDIPENATDVGPKVSALLNEVAAALDAARTIPVAPVAANVQSTNGHVPGAKPQPTVVSPTNGNGTNGDGQRLSDKQKRFMLGLGAKLGMKVADLNARAKARFGPDATIHNLSKAEASALLDELKAEAPPLKGE